MDPLSGILAFLGLAYNNREQQKKSDKALREIREENERQYPNFSYPEPHRDPATGRIVIENYKLYNEDMRIHGAYKAQQWAECGKYNLTPEELKEEKARIKAEYEYLYSLL